MEQYSMGALMIILTKVLKQEGWEPYQAKVGECFAAYGGSYLVKRETPLVLEGSFASERITVFEFPSMQAIEALWHSAEYREIRKLRDGLGQLDVLAVQKI